MTALVGQSISGIKPFKILRGYRKSSSKPKLSKLSLRFLAPSPEKKFSGKNMQTAMTLASGKLISMAIPAATSWHDDCIDFYRWS
jgi:hypothetical protein